MRSGWKFGVMGALVTAGFIAGACGGGGEEGGGATTPTASSAAPTATTPATTETATATTPPTASAPPPVTLPTEFNTATDARKSADARLMTLLGKAGTCDALATEMTKFTKDNASVYSSWNGEWQKLSDDQKKAAMASGANASPVDVAGVATGGMKACNDKKDKKVTAAFAAFMTAASKMPGAASPAGSGSAAPKSSATPKASASAAPKK